MRRGVDLEDRAPLREARALGVVLGAALAKVSDALGDGLAVGAEKRLDALVHLNARDDALLLQEVDHGRAARRRVEERLLVGDGPRDVLAEALGLEEELAVAHAVRLRVLDVDRRCVAVVPVDSSPRGCPGPHPGAAMALRPPGDEPAARLPVKAAGWFYGRTLGGYTRSACRWCPSTRRRRGYPCRAPRWPA